MDPSPSSWRAMTAYQHFYSAVNNIIKQQLIRQGEDSSLGALGSAVAKAFKELDPKAREPYDILEAKDREKADAIHDIKDQAALKEQEERRAANDFGGEYSGSRLRESTTEMTVNVSNVERMPRKKKELTEKEQKQRANLRKQRDEEKDAVKAEHTHLANSRAEQAEARLKYLLAQSDIFAHFGVGKNKKKSTIKHESTATSSSSSSSNPTSPTGARFDRSRLAQDGMDEDERALAAGVDDQKIIAPITQPKIITGGSMRNYQIEGLQWMVRLFDNGINGILADEMGLGKTLQSISIIAYMIETRGITGPHIVMVPKSTLSNWLNEFERWCPSIRVIRFHGSKDERHELLVNRIKPSMRHEARDWDVMVTTYEIANSEKNNLTKIAWRYLIIDEAHRLKNEISQFALTVRALDTQNRILLTGTPLQNNLHELWALLNFLLPDVFSSSEQFDEWFDLDVDDVQAKQRMISQLHKLLRPFMLRRLKADVEKSLPPKMETILFTGMTTTQKDVYKRILMREMNSINAAAKAKSESSKTAILNIVMQLRKCCNHPYLFPGIEDRTLDPLGDHLWKECGKTLLLDKLLSKLFEKGHRVLIFSQMTRMLDILEDFLFAKGYKYCRIDGNTTYEDREDRIQAYNAPNSEKFIFLLSTRAGGLGINLQTADTVVIYDSDWNPQADLQAQDRAHRIGQKKVVQVFRLVTDDTVEVKVVERAQKKLKLDAMVVQQGRLADNDRKLTKNDLLDTLKFGADKIFRSKGDTVTDDDIDKILEDGKKRTAEMTEMMSLAEKGDLYDFKLDGMMSNQVFEGTDYGEKKSKKKEDNTAELPFFIDTGKRERKNIVTYVEKVDKPVDVVPRKPREPKKDKARPKLPRHLKLPKMEDLQFYNRPRLHELHNLELAKWEIMVDEGKILPPGQISRTVVLSPELHQEKLDLLAEGFADWTKVQLNRFLIASAKYGRTNFNAVGVEVDRPVDECKRYAERFWNDGQDNFPETDWDRFMTVIEKGEKRQEEIGKLSKATRSFIKQFNNPWDELTFEHITTNKTSNSIEDRYLLCYTDYYGYGNWEKIRQAINESDRFRMNYWLKAQNEESIGRRCEQLMQYASHEMKLIADKKTSLLIADGKLPYTSSSAEKENNTDMEVDDEIIVDEAQPIPEPDSKMIIERLEIFNTITHSMIAEALNNVKNRADPLVKCGKMFKPAAEVARGMHTPFLNKTQEKIFNQCGNTNTGLKQTRAKPSNVKPIKVFPETSLVDLLKIVATGGGVGVPRLVAKFLEDEKHIGITKKVIETKIQEIGIKERRPDVKGGSTWYVRPEYLHLLGDTGDGNKNDSGAVKRQLPSDNKDTDTNPAKRMATEVKDEE